MTDISQTTKSALVSDNDKITWLNERRKLSDLVPWPRNPRQIKREEASRLVESYEDFAQVEMIAISPENEIYNGHQRLNVWIDRYGPDFEVDVRVSSRPLSEREREKLTVFLHRGAVGDWDYEILANEFDLDDLLDWGFTEKDLDLDMWGGKPAPEEDPGPQIDRADELREKWGVELGQLWQLGNHLLMVGDCTDEVVVNALLGANKAAITFTSPPYNASVAAALSDNKSVVDSFYGDEYDDRKSPEEWLSLMRGFTKLAIEYSSYVFVNVQSLSSNKRALIQYWHEFVDSYADVVIWDKQNAQPAMARRVMNSRFEFVVIFSKEGKRTVGTRDFRGTVPNVYAGNPQRHNKYADSHAATFPIDLPEHFITEFTNMGDMVFDPFVGTGTTVIACERTGRKCVAIDISPAFCAVTIQRYVDMTGGEPLLLSSEEQAEA